MAPAASVIGNLFMYSVAMFTLPFVAFFSTKYFIKEYFDVEDFTNIIWSVLIAVGVVQIIIGLYVRHAVYEMHADNEFSPNEEVKEKDQ